ncbi:uncharacterized protein [Henckelia pumila]|uniref:uncharacterized protein n=1 Tax=Henckelia pumila TaxID=405737 RepID=UPI003C6E0646
MDNLCDWVGAKQLRHDINNNSNPETTCKLWHKPDKTFLNYNVDAAFFKEEHKIGIGCLVRDEEGKVLICRTKVMHGVADVKEGEAMGLLEAILWVQSLGWKKVCFEIDAKGVVEAVTSSHYDVYEFSSIV